MRRLNCYQIRCDGIENGFRCVFGNCVYKLNTKRGIQKRNQIIEFNRQFNYNGIVSNFQELENTLWQAEKLIIILGYNFIK